MNGVIVLIAYGANSIEIPCRMFSDLDKAKERCDKIFGKEGEQILDKATGDLKGFKYKIDLESEEKPWPISSELFTNFYYGYGGPYVFTLTPVEFDTKFVGFDLD